MRKSEKEQAREEKDSERVRERDKEIKNKTE